MVHLGPKPIRENYMKLAPLSVLMWSKDRFSGWSPEREAGYLINERIQIW